MIILQRNNIELSKHVVDHGRDIYVVSDSCNAYEFNNINDAMDHIAGMTNGFDLRLKRRNTDKKPVKLRDVLIMMFIGCWFGMLTLAWMGLL